MSFFQVLFFAILFVASIYFSLLNQSIILVHLSKSTSFELPVNLLILFVFLIGAVVSFVLSLISNIKARMALYQKYRRKEQLNTTFIKGLVYYISGQKNKAKPLLIKTLEKDTSNVVSLSLLGNIYRSQEEFDKAICFHQKAKALAPSDKFVLKNLEEDYEVTKNLNLQKEVVKELTTIEKDNIDNLLRLRDLYKEKENWHEAIAVQNQIIPKIKDPEKLKVEKRKASVFYHECALEAFNSDFFQVAAQMLKNSIKTDPTFTASHMLLGEVSLKTGNGKKTLKAWEYGYQETDDPLFLKRIDKFHMDQNQPSEIIQLYQGAIEKKSNVPLLHFLLGEAYVRFEMFDDAMGEFQKAHTHYPDSIALNLLIGKIFERKDDFKSASIEYQKAFKKELSSFLKFTCSKCGYQISKWVGRCPKCKEWSIGGFDINKSGQKLLN